MPLMGRNDVKEVKVDARLQALLDEASGVYEEDSLRRSYKGFELLEE